jgi:hypothetical protein
MIAEHLKGDHSALTADLMDSRIARIACEHKEILDRQVDGWPCTQKPQLLLAKDRPDLISQRRRNVDWVPWCLDSSRRISSLTQ